MISLISIKGERPGDALLGQGTDRRREELDCPGVPSSTTWRERERERERKREKEREREREGERETERRG